MTRGPVTWARALRATAVALLLLAAVAFAAANFVLVDVHIFMLSFQTRLAWAVLVPAALAFALGVWLGHAGRFALPRDDRGQGQPEVRDTTG